MMKKFLCIALPLCVTFCYAACGESSNSPAASAPPSSSSARDDINYWEQDESYGFHVENGYLTLSGEKFYGIGANCFNLFNSGLNDNYSAETAYRSLNVLKQNGVPVVRFNCGVYYGRELKFYDGVQKDQYLDMLAKIAKKAEELQIGLIPSFFWHIKTIPDYVGEQVIAWGDQTSRTRTFMTQYTRDIVDTLKNYKSVFGWEFGNEFNLQADLPLEVFLETMSREEAEGMQILSESVIDAFSDFTEIVKTSDPYGRMITSGNASLRNAQYNLRKNFSWTPDTQKEHDEMNLMFHPSGMDVISEHNYFLEYDITGADGAKETLTLYEYMKNAVRTCRDNGKAYFVGEFGATEEMFRTMMSTRVQLSLVWNFDTLGQTEYSFTEKTEEGQTILSLLKSCNAEYREIIEDEL